ncbi:hypothetical protein CKK33_00830 [Mucilaginibacter sp. MD40]|uniref:luciferase domain-containing protein n=1 Tax=Mucilaginibacter sp. MD40 TaxID=2029590 RepID=UPI000BAC87E7|nr:luciferase family protein [Mucilaginibacter sp. MD40]PAW92114.1 hypothetical protein CKK33_00830 [Mucilaginibacter sp. MD40]
MFLFIIKYFGFLKHVPGLPHVFDGLLRLYTLLFNFRLLEAIDEIEAELVTWENVTTSLHKYGGLQFNYNGKELGHIHSNGLLDMPLSRIVKQRLMLQDKRVKDHHSFVNSGWISVYMNSPKDSVLAITLFKTSYQQLRDRDLCLTQKETPC